MAKLKPDYIQWVLTLNASGAQKELHKLSESNKDLKASNKELQKEMTKLVAAGKGNSQEFKNLAAQMKKNSATISENNKKMQECEKRLDKTSMSASQLSKKMKALKKELNNTVQSLQPERYRALQRELNETQKAYNKATAGAKQFNGAMGMLQKMKANILGVFAVITTAIMTMGSALRTIIDFEKQQSRLAAVLGTTKAAIKDMTDEARRLGATTAYTASQVTSLQIELAKLGFLKEDIKAMTPAVLKFATAVDTDLASAAGMAGAAIRMFGLEAKDADRVLSTLAIGTTTSALSFEYLQNSLSTVGPVANAFGFSIEEVTALLGTLANVGFDASSAATATRNILLNMADSSGKLAKALGQPVTNLDELVTGLKKLQSEGVNLAEALELTDKRSVAAFESFLKGSDTMLTLRNSVTDAEGAFDAMYGEMSDNVQGALNVLSSTVEGVIMRFYESKGALQDLVKMLTTFVEWIGKAIDLMQEYSGVVKTVAAAVVTYIAAVKMAVLWTNIHRTATIAASGVQALFTGNIDKCTKALKILYATMKANPYALALAGVAALVVGLTQYSKELTEAEKREKRLKEVTEEGTREGEKEVAQLKRLYDATQDTTKSMDERIKKVEELKKQYPDYFGKLSNEKILAGQAADEYKRLADNIIAAAKARAYEKEIDRLTEENLRLEREEAEDKKFLDDNRAKYNKAVTTKQQTNDYVEAATSGFAAGFQETAIARVGANKMTDDPIINQYLNRQESQKKKLAQIESNNKLIQDMSQKVADAQATGALSGGGSGHGGNGGGGGNTGNRFADTKADPNAENDKVKKATADIDRAHEERMLAIRKAAIEENQTQNELTLHESEELIRYQQERNAALLKLQEETPANEEKVHEKILKEVNRGNAEIFNAQVDAENARIGMVQDARDLDLKKEEAYYQTQKDVLEASLLDKQITQEQYNAYMIQLNQAHAEKVVDIEEEYCENIAQVETMSAEKSQLLQEEATRRLRAALMDRLRVAAELSQEIQRAMEADASAEGLANAHERNTETIKRKYDALIEVARQNGLDTVALEKQKNAELIEEDYQYQEKIYQIQQELGLSWQQEYNHELDQLKKMHAKGLISEKQFQKKKLQMQMQNVKKYFDYYSGLSSNMVDAIQQAEIAAVEAKYDVLIQEAENNGEDTTALEEEKANKKLEIEKKYADINMAVKISTIIADTAVSVMRAFADLGPIGGAIAAAMLGATGAAQIAMAVSERNKIKNMSYSNTAGKKGGGAESSPVTAQRVVKGGYADGGYTGDGGKYEVAGVVHKGEYVVPQWLMSDRRVQPAVEMIEALRNQNYLSQAPSATVGFADGGYTSAQDNGQLLSVIKDMTDAVASIKQLKAYIVYQDFEKSSKLITDARNKFSRNK